jgi:hypothetical protein
VHHNPTKTIPDPLSDHNPRFRFHTTEQTMYTLSPAAPAPPTPMALTEDSVTEHVADPVANHVEDSYEDDSDMSGLSSEDDEEELPAPVPVKKAKAKVAKAPRRALKAKVVREPKIKKAAAVKKPRRPYKAMAQEKLVEKQGIADARFEIAHKRMTTIKTQLDRFNFELEYRENSPDEPVVEVAATASAATTGGE